jgi:hypothetical protein
MRLRCCKTFCAASWSFQKSGSDACASSFSSSERFDATSKKPPELFDARAQLFGAQAQVPVFTVRLQSSRHSSSRQNAYRNYSTTETVFLLLAVNVKAMSETKAHAATNESPNLT